LGFLVLFGFLLTIVVLKIFSEAVEHQSVFFHSINQRLASEGVEKRFGDE